HMHVTRPVSRVLYRAAKARRWPFISDEPRGAPRAANPGGSSESRLETVSRFRAAPIRSCSRWGLPCRPCYQRRGARLPHPFTLPPLRQGYGGRFAFCGTVPGVTPAGGYPAPCFLEPGLSSPPYALLRGGAAIRPADEGNKGLWRGSVKRPKA